MYVGVQDQVQLHCQSIHGPEGPRPGRRRLDPSQPCLSLLEISSSLLVLGPNLSLKGPDLGHDRDHTRLGVHLTCVQFDTAQHTVLEEANSSL